MRGSSHEEGLPLHAQGMNIMLRIVPIKGDMQEFLDHHNRNTKEKQEKLGNLFFITCFIDGKILRVLFDSGPTHSFVRAYVEELGLLVKELQFDLVMTTLGNRCNPRDGYWLSTNHILIDYNQKRLGFPKKPMLFFVLAKVWRSVFRN